MFPIQPTQPTNSPTLVNLPRLKIPKFNGNYEDRKSFIDILNALIDSDRKLSDVQKFLYLKLALQNEPLILIEDFKITNDNYKIALDV